MDNLATETEKSAMNVRTKEVNHITKTLKDNTGNAPNNKLETYQLKEKPDVQDGNNIFKKF